jgi:sugar lactone lactonase YvrE
MLPTRRAVTPKLSHALQLLLPGAALLSGCASTSKPAEPAQRALVTSPVGGAEATPSPLLPVYVHDVGFETPESVLYDPETDLYLVSNVLGSPLEPDDRAFISRVRPDGSVENLKWIDAEDPAVRLDAPKGLALAGDVLYVADIASVRKFERRTGKPLGAIEIPGATFINDLCADEAENLYVSDSGIRSGFTPSGGDAIYKISAGAQVSVLAKSEALGRPNGLALAGDTLWVATFGSGELFRLSASGERARPETPPKGSLDGVVIVQGRVFVSSWEGSAIYERTDAGFVERVGGVAAPSDIGFDPKRQRLLIPLFYDDALLIQPISDSEG